MKTRGTTNEASALRYRLGGECKPGNTCRHYNHTLPNRKRLIMYDFLCLLYRLSTPALELMLQGEGDDTRRELIAGEIEARHANRH